MAEQAGEDSQFDEEFEFTEKLDLELEAKHFENDSLFEEDKFKVETPRTIGHNLAPAIRMIVLLIVCFIAFAIRVFPVLKYESIIHEFDPWFNYRATEVLVNQGYYEFRWWTDHNAWYPISRAVGETVYPGMMVTSWILQLFVKYVLLMPIHIREICVFSGPLFASLTCIAAYLLAKELSGKAAAGLISALLIAVLPTYISRSVAGHYDNEAMAIFAIVLCFYTFMKSVRTGSILDATICAISYYYMMMLWGGYVFVLGCISGYVIVMCLLNKLSPQIYMTYSIFYILGTQLAKNIPLLNFYTIYKSSEHVPSHAAFYLIQLVMFYSFVKKFFSKSSFLLIQKVFLASSILVILGYFVWNVSSGKTYFGHRMLSLLNPTTSKGESVLTQSISEHASTTWGNMFVGMQYGYVLAPMGVTLLVTYPHRRQAALFALVMISIGMYFASVMIRLLLVGGPLSVVLAGIAMSWALERLCQSVQLGVYWIYQFIAGLVIAAKGAISNPKKLKKAPIPYEFAPLGIILIATICMRAVWYGSDYSAVNHVNPAIIGSFWSDGHRVMIEEIREGYNWLRSNTKPSARVAAWWDYGYQIAGLANRTTYIDNNTWNMTHIAMIGSMLATDEHEAYKMAKELDIDYVLVFFSGLRDVGGDDISKFLWFPRIGNSWSSRFKEADYVGPNGYQVSQQHATPALKRSIAYRMCYHDFSYVDSGRGPSYDHARGYHIGTDPLDMKYFTQAFSSTKWSLRIYKVKPTESLDEIAYNGEAMGDLDDSLYRLTFIAPKVDLDSLEPNQSSYLVKNVLANE